MRRTMAAGLAALAMLSAAGAGRSQGQEPQPSAEECRALGDTTHTEGAEGQGVQGENAPATGAQDLSAMLERCKGVLAPPKTGDSEIVEPAPGVGRTPVIKPEEIEPQPSQ